MGAHPLSSSQNGTGRTRGRGWGVAKQERKERMLLGWRLGRSPHFFLSSEVGGCYSSWLASQGALNAQKAPRLPQVVLLAKKEQGFCGS